MPKIGIFRDINFVQLVQKCTTNKAITLLFTLLFNRFYLLEIRYVLKNRYNLKLVFLFNLKFKLF